MANRKRPAGGALSDLYAECRDLRTYVLGLQTTVKMLDESGDMMTYQDAGRELTCIHDCLGSILKRIEKYGHEGRLSKPGMEENSCPNR